MTVARTARYCPRGHQYFKSSNCRVCPICESELKSSDPFGFLSAPARRALNHAGITSLSDLSNKKEADLLNLHGFGPSSIPKIKAALSKIGLILKV